MNRSLPLAASMSTRRLVAAASLALLGSIAASATAQTGAAGWDSLKDGSVFIVRHANAPGVGDPSNFRLGDCATQRNLDDKGRAQAKRMGDEFRRRGVTVGAVLTSQWCRTRDTAQLAFPGLPRDDASFNSFFGESTSEPAQTAAALATLSRWKGPGVLVVVTHQVNITALTGAVPSSAEGVVARPKAAGIDVLGRLEP